ncbi:MAG: AAA family ATPase [Deltaproteobacteria bacterium]|nr:MAG: AAA family ATPase [Deltaproteobacteria bacterium]
MRKKFNDTGLCIPGRHYMADTSRKIAQIMQLVEEGAYFTINRPRQFGKTTILSLLAKELNQRDDYLTLKISFEEIDAETYQNREEFLGEFLMLMLKRTEQLNYPDLSALIEQHVGRIVRIPDLSRFITKLVRHAGSDRSLVLFIDEVDKSANNQLFLDFLAMLRSKYLQQNEGEDDTFHSVVLAGVHDVKTLKAKIRPEDERKYNSPWNIAADFTVDLSFSPDEIGAMLHEYSRNRGIRPDIPAIAGRLHYYTSGYPYLVSKLCKFIDEQIIPPREDRNWSVSDVDEAFRMITDEGYTTTIFDSLTKNLENNAELYDTVLDMVINGRTTGFNISDPVIALGHLYGVFSKTDDRRCRIHNRIYEQRIYAYTMSKSARTGYPELSDLAGPEFLHDDILDVRLILQRFQTFLKEHTSDRDEKFLEREGRLLFLSFLRPIINGKGFEFKEPNVGDERRMDLVITYKARRYVVELKRWYGPKAHQEGLGQLSDYLETYSLREGYLLIYDFRKKKEYRQEEILFQDKRIFAVWV